MYKALPIAILIFSSTFVFSQEDSDTTHAKFYYDDGTLSSEGAMVDKQPTGYWKNYFPSGVLKSEGNRKGAALDGLWKFYNEEGILAQSITYQNGVREGLTSVYNNEGFLISTTPYQTDKKEGVAFTYFDNGGIKDEIPFTRGRENGKAYEFNIKGQIITIRTYKNGIITRQEIVNRRNKNNQKQGLWKEFYDDRTVRVEGRFKDGEKDGYWKDYTKKGLLEEVTKFEDGRLIIGAEEIANLTIEERYFPDSDGKISFRGTFLEGKPHGTHIWYAFSGEIDSVKVFKSGHLIAEGDMTTNGLKTGNWKEYYFVDQSMKAEGAYRSGYRFGEWVYYFPMGTIEQKGNYGSKGKPEGKWNWYYSSGKKLRVETFKKGKENGLFIEYSEDGKEIARGEFIDDLEEGEWFYEIGDHLEKGRYEAGNKQGVWEHFYLSNGQLRFKGEYFDDLPQEKHTWYYDNGKKMLEGKFTSGVKEGEWRRYNLDGTIRVIIEYQAGVEVRVDGQKIKVAGSASKEDKGSDRNAE